MYSRQKYYVESLKIQNVPINLSASSGNITISQLPTTELNPLPPFNSQIKEIINMGANNDELTIIDILSGLSHEGINITLPLFKKYFYYTTDQ
jgi:hypothetical protein